MSEPAFNGTILEGRERRYTVINERDLKKYVHPEKLDRFYEVLNDVLGDIEEGRERDGKHPYNCYVVINVDEPYINEIVEIMKRHGHWG
jgi:hypothetical protein